MPHEGVAQPIHPVDRAEDVQTHLGTVPEARDTSPGTDFQVEPWFLYKIGIQK